MFTPWNIACRANTFRGQLKHSWLENQVCNKTANDVATLWRTQIWDEVIGEIFQYRIDQMRELANELVNGFSPAQLVDQLSPLQNFSEENRFRLKNVLHSAYIENSGISALSELLSQEIEGFAQEFTRFLTVWNTKRTDENEPALRHGWNQLQQVANSLLAVFEKLPKGVVLP